MVLRGFAEDVGVQEAMEIGVGDGYGHRDTVAFSVVNGGLGGSERPSEVSAERKEVEEGERQGVFESRKNGVEEESRNSSVWG